MYWDGYRYQRSTPTIIPNIRLHVALWQRFRRASGAWPTLSIIAYIVRFAIAIAGIAISVWYGERHDWSYRGYDGRDRMGAGYLFSLAVVFSAVAVWWFLAELRIWNYYLRKLGFSSKTDLWDTDQFPSTKP